MLFRLCLAILSSPFRIYNLIFYSKTKTIKNRKNETGDNVDNRSIGLLDSGLGGLTVLEKIADRMPEENTVFIADQARLPYGDRPDAEIKLFTRQLVDFLLAKDVKVIIFACNTATAIAMEDMRSEIEVPIIGVIQSGSLAASRVTKNRKIGVISTQATAKSHAYQREIAQRLENDVEVLEVPTPKLVPLIEGDEELLADNPALKESIAPIVNSDIDTLILGCTHYPLIEKQIEQNLADDVLIIDPANQVANYTQALLEQRDLLTDSKEVTREYYTTGDAAHFSAVASKLLGANITAGHAVVD